jgi:hypothetical protein
VRGGTEEVVWVVGGVWKRLGIWGLSSRSAS